MLLVGCSCCSHEPAAQVVHERAVLACLLQVFDHDSDGGHDLIGRCEASLQQLRDAALHGHGLVLVNPKKQLVRHYVSSGV